MSREKYFPDFQKKQQKLALLYVKKLLSGMIKNL